MLYFFFHLARNKKNYNLFHGKNLPSNVSFPALVLGTFLGMFGFILIFFVRLGAGGTIASCSFSCSSSKSSRSKEEKVDSSILWNFWFLLVRKVVQRLSFNSLLYFFDFAVTYIWKSINRAEKTIVKANMSKQKNKRSKVLYLDKFFSVQLTKHVVSKKFRLEIFDTLLKFPDPDWMERDDKLLHLAVRNYIKNVKLAISDNGNVFVSFQFPKKRLPFCRLNNAVSSRLAQIIRQQ